MATLKELPKYTAGALCYYPAFEAHRDGPKFDDGTRVRATRGLPRVLGNPTVLAYGQMGIGKSRTTNAIMDAKFGLDWIVDADGVGGAHPQRGMVPQIPEFEFHPLAAGRPKGANAIDKHLSALALGQVISSLVGRGLGSARPESVDISRCSIPNELLDLAAEADGSRKPTLPGATATQPKDGRSSSSRLKTPSAERYIEPLGHRNLQRASPYPRKKGHLTYAELAQKRLKPKGRHRSNKIEVSATKTNSADEIGLRAGGEKVVCDKCDGAHATASCAQFKQAREAHPDAQERRQVNDLGADGGCAYLLHPACSTPWRGGSRGAGGLGAAAARASCGASLGAFCSTTPTRKSPTRPLRSG